VCASSPRLLRLFVGRLEASPAGFEMLSLPLGTQATVQFHPENSCTPKVEMAVFKVEPSLEISLENVTAKQWS